MGGYLKKEFTENDISRIRNIIKGKHGDKSKIQVGFSKPTINIKYKEGDIWEDNLGIRWTINNGVKQNISKNSLLKNISKIPLFCPECNNIMKGRFDNKMYNIHKKCFNCVIEYETKLKREGKFEEYQSKLMKSNANDVLNDLEDGLDDYINNIFQKEQIFTEIGDIEEWDNQKVDVDSIKKDIRDHLKEVRDKVLN